MKKPTPIYLSTHRTAQLFGLEKHTVHARVRRTGSCNGVTPIRLENGDWGWPADEVYRAAGLFPEGKLPAAQGLQDRIIEATGADLLATHRVIDWLFETSRDAATAREAIDELHADLRDVLAVLAASVSRLGFALKYEDEMTPADIETNLRFAVEIDRQLGSAVRFLRWRLVASATGGSK